MLWYSCKGAQCHSTTTREASATVHLKWKPVPQYNYSGSQCHSTTVKEASATVQLQGKPVPQCNDKGSQCHSTTRETSAAGQLQWKPVLQYNYKGSQCHSTSTKEASATVQLQGGPAPQDKGASATIHLEGDNRGQPVPQGSNWYHYTGTVTVHWPLQLTRNTGTKVQLQWKPVPQHNNSGSQCHSTAVVEASATAQL